MYSLWNPTAQPVDLTATITYGNQGGVYHLPVHLAPSASSMISIMDLIRKASPDMNGQTIPASTTVGALKITTTSDDLRDTATFVIAGGIFNPVAGTCCINYITCPGAVSSQISPSSFSLAAGTSMNFQFFLIDGDGSQWDNTWEATWQGSSSVMSVTPATGTGLEAGSAGISANISGIDEYVYQFCGAYCPTGGQGASASGTVYDASPSISLVTPNTFTVGKATPNVQIQGQNFGTNLPTVTFSLGSVQVTSHIDTTIAVTATANVAGTGNFTITSTGYNGQKFQSNNGGSAQATSPSVTATGATAATITGPTGIPLGGSASYTVGVSPSTNTQNIVVSISLASGTGSAQFSDGTTSKTITATTTLTIKGVTASSAVNNIAITAALAGGQLAKMSVSVVSVTITLRNSGQPSQNNSAGGELAGVTGSPNLGQVIEPTSPNTCAVSVELDGQVQPSGYGGTLTLKRTIVSNDGYAGTGGSTIVSPAPSVNGSDDTSSANLRDDNPSSSGGYIYDLDAPGISFSPPNPTYILRFRVNLQEYATLDSDSSNTKIGTLNWYERSSCKLSSNGISGAFSSDVSGDNTAAAGTTPISWNLK